MINILSAETSTAAPKAAVFVNMPDSDKCSDGRLKILRCIMTSSMYILLLLAFIFANAPFLIQRLLGVFKLKRKHIGHHLFELFIGFGITAALAYVLESRAGVVHNQDWEFYAVVICLYLIFAFPAFVWRYFWHGRNRE